MMILRWCFFVLFVLLGKMAVAQDFALIAPIDTAAKFIAVDNLDNTYLITPKDELLKYNASGKLMWRYSNKAFGKAGFVDASDPLRTLLFYPGLQQIVVLNNNLSEISRYRFSDASRQVTLASLSSTNGFWYFDQANFELHRISNNFEDLQRSGNMYQVIGKALQPTLLQANGQFVYLYDPKIGILQFDRFGAYLKTIRIEPLNYFEARENKILYLRENTLVSLDTQTYEPAEFHLPVDEQVIQASLGTKIIALRSGKSVYLYSVKANIR
ncbi:MAG: hypothetical protein K0S09_2811 [Sphingobacteriaceae bacterium]|jgi:hypothetical protein|nr:hypothetical protein [Sphingobacteriaceae bacterium]